jgi:hypothetical protein
MKQLDEIKYELEKNYRNWRENKLTLENNEYFSEDENYFSNCEFYYRQQFNDLYIEYTKSFKQYIFSGNIFFIFFRLIYWFRYRQIKKDLKKFLFYLKVKYD